MPIAKYFFCLLICFLKSCMSLEVRLKGSSQNVLNYGRIEVYYKGKWGTVCSDNLRDPVCVVVCRQLGYSYGVCITKEDDGNCIKNNKKMYLEVADQDVPIWISGVHCKGHERNLEECWLGDMGEVNCSHHDDAGCVCITQPEKMCEKSRHRIRPFEDSKSSSAGVVEIQNELGEWGVVCDDGWDDDDAYVFCSCLGYKDSRFFKAMLSSRNPSKLPMLYSHVDCSADDKSSLKNLWDCGLRVPAENCNSRYEVAAVSCAPETSLAEEHKVNSICKGSSLSGCFIGLQDSYKLEHFSVEHNCLKAQFKKTANNFCFEIDMLKCQPSSTKFDDGKKSICYDINYKNLETLHESNLMHGTSWLQRVCCGVTTNMSVVGVFSPQKKTFDDVITSNKQNHNVTMECFKNELIQANSSLKFPAHVGQGDLVTCFVDLSTWDSRLLLTIPDCYFAVDPLNISFKSFQFLQNKCAVTSKLGVKFYSSNGLKWGFKFRMPKFEDENSLFVMCRAHLCDPTHDGKHSCDRSCLIRNGYTTTTTDMPEVQINKKKKRSLRHQQEKMLDKGPFIVNPRKNQPIIVRDGSHFKIDIPSDVKSSSCAVQQHVSSFIVAVSGIFFKQL